MEILPCLRKLQLPSHVYMQVLILIVWTETASLPAFLPATDNWRVGEFDKLREGLIKIYAYHNFLVVNEILV